MKCSIAVVLGSVVASVAHARRPWELVLRTDPLDGPCNIVSFRLAQVHKGLTGRDVIEEVNPVPVPHPGADHSVYRLLSHDADSLLSQAQLHCSNDLFALFPGLRRHSTLNQAPFSRDGFDARVSNLDLPHLELIPLIISGPADNRVDLAFFADGYASGERQRFLDDATRLARDLSTNQTFFTVKPLLNFWAVYVPSKESGIGVGGKAKDTPFGLYRDGTELRALYANNSDIALAACASLGDKCDYAILLANDPLYGGLGGEYTTTTASLANGALVLRHEIGHSIIQVGEEYDGGFAYFGVNAARNPEEVAWPNWLTYREHTRVERCVMPMQAYPWLLLDVAKPWAITFPSSGTYMRHLVKFSLSGIPRADDLFVFLDGSDLRWTPRHDIGVDRWHYDLLFEDGLDEGEHVLEFVLRNREIQGQAQLCSVEVLEYGSPDEFNATRGHYSLFPTYDLDNGTTYRPTNDDCLMRTVTNPDFCSVCLEGLWLSLLARVDLVEDLRMTCAAGGDTMRVELELVKLAQFREKPVERVESYAIEWTRNGRALEALVNRTQAELSEGTYRVDVTYAIDEVRSDPRGYLRASRAFEVTPNACG